MNNVSTPSPSGNASFDPWLLWIAFRRAWFWVLPLGLLLAGGTIYLLHQTFVPEYQAIHILEANSDYIVFQGVITAPANFAQTERHLLSNALVLDPVLADAEVARAPSLADPETRERELRKRIVVSDAGTKQLLTVSYRDPDPQYAALVCNTIVNSYLRQRQSFDNKRISELEGWLRPAIDKWESEVKSYQERVRQLSQQARGFDPFKEVTRLDADTSTMTGLFGQLTQVKVDEELLRARIEAESARLASETLEEVVPVNPSPLEIKNYVAADVKVAELRSRRAAKRAQMHLMEDSDLVRINRDWYTKLAREVTQLAREQEQAEEFARRQAIEYLRQQNHEQTGSNRGERLVLMQNELADVVSRRRTLEKNFDEEKSRLEQFAGETADLYFAQQQYTQAASILEKLNTRIASLRTERQRGGTIQTLAKATPPVTPIEEMPLKKFVVMGGGAFALPFLLAVFWEFVVKRLSTPEAIESRQLMPVIGEVAQLPYNNAAGGKRRVFEESVDSLRSNLLMSHDLANIRSLAVTSSMSGEGKSSLISQLAVSIAKASGETVLLVDADIRSPDQHHLFGIDMGPGLVKVLTGQAKLDDAIDRSLGGLVHVLPAGYLNANPHRILSPSGVRDLVDQALNEIGYRYVLFDTAPVLSAGETLAVTCSVDATLLCVMRDVSRMPNVERTVKRLQTTGSTLAGMVFNGVPSRQYAYRYGDYRYGDLQRQVSPTGSS